MTILVPVVSAAEQVNNLLDIENPFVYFSEENNTSIYFDFNNSHTLSFSIPNGAQIDSAIISLTALDKVFSLFNCSKTCIDSSCEAPNNVSNFSCNYKVSMSIPELPVPECETPGIMIGSHYYGKAVAGDSSCEIDSGCTCIGFGPKSCSGDSKSCNAGDTITSSWFFDSEIGVSRSPGIYIALWRWRNKWQCYDPGLGREPTTRFNGNNSVEMNYSYIADSCPEGYNSTSLINNQQVSPELTLGNNTLWSPGVQENETEHVLNLTQEIQESLENCSESICEIPLVFNSSTGGALTIDNSSLNYSITLNYFETNTTRIGNYTNLFVGENLTYQKNVTLVNDFFIDMNLTLNEINQTVILVENSTWFYSLNITQQGAYWSYQNLTFENNTTYFYDSLIVIPFDFPGDVQVNANLSLMDLPEFNNSGSFNITLNEKEVNYTIVNESILFILEEDFQKLVVNAFEDSKYFLKIVYDVPKEQEGFQQASPEEPTSSGGGGGGGGSFSGSVRQKPIKKEVELNQEVLDSQEIYVPVSVETPEPVNDVIEQTSKATGYLHLVPLSSKSRIFVAIVCSLLLSFIIGTRITNFKLPKPKLQLSKSKLKHITPKPQSVVLKPEIFNNHMKTILKGLSEREQEILKILMEYKGQTTQARIYHATGIPTTSLSRWMDSLERKGLIESNRRGKLRDLKITTKFRGE
jgi:uncharacterized membrane protein